MYLLNPQIINGGQTAFTLSRIYEKLSDTEREEIFSGKEVLVKAIALTKTSGQEDDDSSRVALIERISTATNSQSVVTLADRTSGDPLHTNIQKALFDRFGLLYERKRGEFAGALRDGYIWQEDVINRAIFARLFLTATGRLKSAIRRRVLAEPLGSLPITEAAQLDRFIIAYKAFEVLRAGSGHLSNRRYSEILPKVHASLIVASELNNEIEVEHRGLVAANIVQDRWPSFLSFAAKPWPQV